MHPSMYPSPHKEKNELLSSNPLPFASIHPGEGPQLYSVIYFLIYSTDSYKVPKMYWILLLTEMPNIQKPCLCVFMCVYVLRCTCILKQVSVGQMSSSISILLLRMTLIELGALVQIGGLARKSRGFSCLPPSTGITERSSNVSLQVLMSG